MPWRWRKVRKADIPKHERDVFERFGEAAIRLTLAGCAGGSTPKELMDINAPQRIAHAVDWLTERADYLERRENRLETVEWAILVFVVAGVFADFALAFGWFHCAK